MRKGCLKEHWLPRLTSALLVTKREMRRTQEATNAAMAKPLPHSDLIAGEVVEFKLSPCLDKSLIACCGGGSALVRWSTVGGAEVGGKQGREERWRRGRTTWLGGSPVS